MSGINYPNCNHCGFIIPSAANCCPHCGLPMLFPNVRAAELGEEVKSLDARYAASISDAQLRNAEKAVRDFEEHVARSEAVVAMPILEALRLANSEYEGHVTYYQRLESGARLLNDDAWDRPRHVADDILFMEYRKDIHFGALTLNERGVRSYGECFVVLHTHMIEHRSSIFHTNSGKFVRDRKIDLTASPTLPWGFKSNWSRRGILSVPKLAHRIHNGTLSTEYPDILLQNGTTSADDDFIEVHTYGSFTIRTIKCVRVPGPLPGITSALVAILQDKLSRLGISCTLIK